MHPLGPVARHVDVQHGLPKARVLGRADVDGDARPWTATASSSPGRWLALTWGRARMCRKRTESGAEPKWNEPR